MQLNKLKNTIMTLYESLIDNLWYTPISGIKNVYRSFKRACGWFKFGYKQADWDYTYIYSAISYQIERMIKEFENCKHHEHSKDIEKMKEFKKLSDSFANNSDFQTDYIFDELNKKWGECILEFSGNNSGGTFHVVRENIKTEEDFKEYKKDFLQYEKERIRIHKEFKNKFFKFFKNSIERWWC